MSKMGTRSCMKNKINSTLHDRSNLTKATSDGNEARGQLLKLGLDVDLRNIAVAIQCERGAIGPARKFCREQFIGWLKQKIALGYTVHAVSESCGFGYTLHEELTQAGAHSLITTPMRLNLERRRKNDRMDARELCVRLSRYLDGYKDELRPIRIPSRAEQQRRELGRQREFWKKQLRRLENHGRALRIEHEHETLPAGWAGPRKWKVLAPAMQRLCARSTGAGGRANPRDQSASRSAQRRDRNAGGRAKNSCGPGGIDRVTDGRRGVRLEAFLSSQSGGKLHRLLSQRT